MSSESSLKRSSKEAEQYVARQNTEAKIGSTVGVASFTQWLAILGQPCCAIKSHTLSSTSPFVSSMTRPSSMVLTFDLLKMGTPKGKEAVKSSMFALHKCPACHLLSSMRECCENDAHADIIIPMIGLPEEGRVDPTCE
jgi:hypothetical protein